MAFDDFSWHRGGMTLRRPAAGLAAALLTLALAACGNDAEPAASEAGDAGEQTSESSTDAEPEASPSTKADKKAKKKAAKQNAEPAVAPGAWIDLDTYRADQAAYESSDVVLFFAATWCHTCQSAQASLDTDGVPDGLAVVKVDYDTETDLRKKYGVTVQHTFVHINDEGEALKKWSGSESGAAIQAEI